MISVHSECTNNRYWNHNLSINEENYLSSTTYLQQLITSNSVMAGIDAHVVVQLFLLVRFVFKVSIAWWEFLLFVDTIDVKKGGVPLCGVDTSTDVADTVVVQKREVPLCGGST